MLGRALLALLALAAPAAAGAGSVWAAETELGATIESVIYHAEDETLTIVDRSTSRPSSRSRPAAGGRSSQACASWIPRMPRVVVIYHSPSA